MARDREGRLEHLGEGKMKAPRWIETVGPDSPQMEVLRKSEDETRSSMLPGSKPQKSAAESE